MAYESANSLLGLLDHGFFVEGLALHLTMADLVILCQTCQRLYRAKEKMLKSVSKLYPRLKKFVDEPTSFRLELENCGGLITGPFALNLLELNNHDVPYLDVYIKAGVQAQRFINFIREEQYQKAGEDGLGGILENDNEAENESVPGCQIYTRVNHQDHKIRLTKTNESPIMGILTGAYTSASVNFITWRTAWCIFPRQTLIEHTLPNWEAQFRLRLCHA
ncbi:hypothetical protein HJFPF1_07799 [Paramyrothecium foliicola]|nr:hypothetical protein HJFPF1_07799 [Paramyrothecium foliicola]